MTNYIFLLEIYFIISLLVFLYPKELWKRNHIINAILMGFFLVLTEVILTPSGFELTWDNIVFKAMSAMPIKSFSTVDLLEFYPTLIDKFRYSILLPIGFFIFGHILYYFKKININTFDILFTGLFPAAIYIDFIIFLGLKGIGALAYNYISFFIIYAILSYARIELFMFLGIKKLLDEKEFS